MQIRMRGYCKEKEVMYSHDQLLQMCAKNDIFNSRKIEIMLDTFFVDKNAINIFEGDILETPLSKKQRIAYIVEYNVRNGIFLATPFSKGRGMIRVGLNLPNNPIPLKDIVKEDIYIIGNKYENEEIIDRRLASQW